MWNFFHKEPLMWKAFLCQGVIIYDKFIYVYIYDIEMARYVPKITFAKYCVLYVDFHALQQSNR